MKTAILIIVTVSAIYLYGDNSKPPSTNLETQIVKVAKNYKLSPKLFRAILVTESSLNVGAINNNRDGTSDYGIGQINEKTMKSYGFDKTLLLTNETYSLMAAGRVLSDFQRMYSHKEPKTWWCRYNVGTRKYKKVAKLCFRYMKRVMKRMK